MPMKVTLKKIHSLRNWLVSAIFASCLGLAEVQAQQNNAELESHEIDVVEVTARLIVEPLQRVPVSVSVVNTLDLRVAQVNSSEDLFRAVPNFNFTDSGLPEANLLNLRGIGSASTFLSPSLTYYVDGVAVPQRAFDIQFVDVERIEVLRGPQGTLYGQNSQAGAINIITAKPSREPQLVFATAYGSDNERRLRASGSTALTEQWSGRLAVAYLERDGDLENIQFTGPASSSHSEELRQQRNLSLQGKLHYQLSDATEMMVSGRVQNDQRHPSTGALIIIGEGHQNVSPNALGPVPSNDLDSQSLSLQLNHNFGDLRLTSISGYEAYDLAMRADITDGFIASAGSGLPAFIFAANNTLRKIDESYEQWSQELRIHGTGEELSWLFGFNGMWSQFDSTTDVNSPFLASGVYTGQLDKQNLALFGQAEWQLAEQWRSSLGLRYSHERTDLNGAFAGRPGNIPAAARFVETGKSSTGMLTGRMALSYDFDEQQHLFVSVARGAKAAGYPFYNQSAAFSIPLSAYAQSSTWAYELGLKGRLLGRRLFYSLALFYNDTKDEQLFIFNPVAAQFLVESADTQAHGLEFELQTTLGNNFELNTSFAYLQAQAVKDNGASVRDGNTVPYAPEFSASIAANYRFPLADGELMLSAQYHFTGERKIDPANSLELNDYDLLNARISYRWRQLEIYAYGKNLFDEDYIHSGFAAGVSPLGQRQFAGIAGRGRSYGLGLSWSL